MNKHKQAILDILENVLGKGSVSCIIISNNGNVSFISNRDFIPLDKMIYLCQEFNTNNIDLYVSDVGGCPTCGPNMDYEYTISDVGSGCTFSNTRTGT